MDLIWLHLLSLSVLLSLTLCKPHEYVLVREPADWGTAQEYCRKNHLDLATIQSEDDWANLKEVALAESFTGFGWTGLYNDITGWRWSRGDERMVFTSWLLDQPNNYGTGEECVAIGSAGFWDDRYCALTKYFLCSDESANATDKMVLIRREETWLDAQRYCRKHYTDLATIRSKDDNALATSLVPLSLQPWIGLYRETWKWSDQANFTSSTQLVAQTFIRGTENCAGAYYYGVFDDYYCTTLYPFFCSTIKRKRQLIRVQVKVRENMDDATLSALVSRQLQQMLSDPDVTLTWKKQSNGKVFQKKNTSTKPASAASPPHC